MKFKKPSSELVEFLHEAMAPYKAEPRQMFGCPCYFVNGNMFSGVFEDSMFIRLSDADRAALAGEFDEAAPFEPMPGRPMREYMVLPEQLTAKRTELRRWLDRSHAYVAGLPRKEKKGKGKKK